MFSERPEAYISFSKKILEIIELPDFVSIDETKEDTLYAYVPRHHLKGISFPFNEVLPPSMQISPSNFSMRSILPNWDAYPSYPGYLDIMYSLADSFPQICSLDTIGYSVNGKLVIALRINGSGPSPKPKVFLSSTMHGDETTGYVVLLRLAYEMIHDYSNVSRITDLIDSIDLVINPLANPDGTYFLSDTSVWGATRSNANGYDLNRNFPDPKSGPTPGGPRQPETQDMMDYMEEHRFHLSANLHGGAEVINYPWDTWQRRHADDSWWIKLCREYADTAQALSPNGYLQDLSNGITNGFDWYSIDGGRQDYTTFFLRGREVTMELSGVKLLPANLLPAYYSYNKAPLLNYISSALTGVSGLVMDSSTMLPVKAELSIANYDQDQSSIFSDSLSGYYKRFLDSGIYILSFSAPGYLTKDVSVSRNFWKDQINRNVYLTAANTGIALWDSPKWKVAPNPFKEELILEVEKQDLYSLLQYSLIDLRGKVVKQGMLTPYKTRLNLNFRGQLPGTYLLVLNSRKRRKVFRLSSH